MGERGNFKRTHTGAITSTFTSISMATTVLVSVRATRRDGLESLPAVCICSLLLQPSKSWSLASWQVSRKWSGQRPSARQADSRHHRRYLVNRLPSSQRGRGAGGQAHGL